jgi:class 3 adenylate cyclase
MKILIADDNPDNIELVKDIVDVMGHDSLSALDGQSALEVAQAQVPDLVILDVNMPGMSGFEVIAHLKSDEITSKIPVIMLTAMADIDNRVEGLGLGADDYLTKPFSPRELMARIETRLRAKVETDDLRNTKEMIRQTFERFVPPSVVAQLLKDPTQVKLGGVLQEVTILFSDLENFTSISERTDPEKLLKMLNTYHTLVVKIIQQNGGTVDKFIGDGVMALYNTPLQQDDHALRAVLTALQIRETLGETYLEFERDFHLRINFGIHTGQAVVGNVGSADIMDFTAVGDTVNIAARLQGLAENGQILVSEATFEQVQEYVEAIPIGAQTVKGRIGTIMTYQVNNLR